MQCTKMEGSPHENWNSIIYIQEKNNTQDWNRVMCTNSHVHGHAPKADYNLWRPVRETLSWHLNIWKVKFDYFKKRAFKAKSSFMIPFYGWGSSASRLKSHYEQTVYFLPLSAQTFLVLIWSTSEEWKAESTLEPLCGFELRTIGFTNALFYQKCSRQKL